MTNTNLNISFTTYTAADMAANNIDDRVYTEEGVFTFRGKGKDPSNYYFYWNEEGQTVAYLHTHMAQLATEYRRNKALRAAMA